MVKDHNGFTTARNSGGRWHAWNGDGQSGEHVGGFLTEAAAIEELHDRYGLPLGSVRPMPQTVRELARVRRLPSVSL